MEDIQTKIDIHNKILDTMINISEKITNNTYVLVNILDSIKQIDEIYINTNIETDISLAYLVNICSHYKYIAGHTTPDTFLGIYCKNYMQCSLVYNTLELLLTNDINLTRFPNFKKAVLLILKSYNGTYIIDSEQKIIMFENIRVIVEKLMFVIEQNDEKLKAKIITSFENGDFITLYLTKMKGYEYITRMYRLLVGLTGGD